MILVQRGFSQWLLLSVFGCEVSEDSEKHDLAELCPELVRNLVGLLVDVLSQFAQNSLFDEHSCELFLNGMFLPLAQDLSQ